MDNIVLSIVVENTLYSYFMVYNYFAFNKHTAAGTYCMDGPKVCVAKNVGFFLNSKNIIKAQYSGLPTMKATVTRKQ